jgi:hypothetical protein
VDNQDSSPALIFPNVPDDFCPTGNWTDVFQQFIDTVLTNGTINIPGLGDVTPGQIQTINDYLLNLQNQINILADVQVRQGTVSALPINDSTHSVTFTTAMPSDNFRVAFTPRLAASAGSASYPTFILQTGSKSINGFSFLCENNGSPAIISEVEWVAIHSS